MRPVTDGFLAAVNSSHTMDVRARLVPAGQTGTDPDGDEIPVLDGDVKLAAGGDIAATLDLTTVGDWPHHADSPMAPYGKYEVFVERGVKVIGGSTEWVSLGYYRLDTIEQEKMPAGTFRISASDRMAGIVDAQLVSDIQVMGYSTYGYVVENFVTAVYPAAVVDWDDSAARDQLIGRALVTDKDRYKFLNELVTGLGKIWEWDYRGHLVVRDAPDPAEPVATIRAGTGGVLVEAGRSLTRDGVHNIVVATGEAPGNDPAARAVARDADPSSPTYYRGPFGPVPTFYSSSSITTDEQAATAARAMLTAGIGLPYNVDLSAVPNPALELRDPVELAYPSEGTTRKETHVIDKMTIPLTPDDALEATTREQTNILIEVTT